MRVRQLISNTIACLLMLLVYCALTNWYIYELICEAGTLSYRQTKLIKEYSTLLVVAFSTFNLCYISNEPHHKQSACLCILALCWNYVLNIIIQHDFINQLDAPYYFFAFNGVIVAITFAVLKEGIKYGIFNYNE